MNLDLHNLFGANAGRKTTILLWLSVVFFTLTFGGEALAQKKFAKNYPASRDVRLELTNRTGTVTVEGWDRQEVAIFAYLEHPAANITPQSLSGTIVLNLVKDNQGRNEVGNVNFFVRVPYTSTVYIETKMGNLNVKNIHGSLVRAHVSSEGDITLVDIGAARVSAENVIGDIFYDGLIQREGNYNFRSMRGNINLRIPLESSFKLVATAPSTRGINLGEFSNEKMNVVGDGRRVIGKMGDGSATLSVTNQRGTISFFRR